MIRSMAALLGILQCACAVSVGQAVPSVPQPIEHWPTASWKRSTAEEQGFSSVALAHLVETALDSGWAIHNLVVVRRGHLVLDASFYPFQVGTRHDVASITKSVTSLAVGMAIEDGFIAGLDESVARHLPGALTANVTRHSMNIGHLLGMQSGLDCGFSRGEAELHAMKLERDWVKAVLALPARHEPGKRFGYCSGNYHLLSAVLQASTGRTERDFVGERLFAPLGITDVNWPADPQGTTRGWGDLQLRPTDLAKVGVLLLQGGRWEGKPIINPAWIALTSTPRAKYGDDNLYGYGWWTHPDSPVGFFEAIGRGGQRLSVWPEKDLVVVMLGGGFRPGNVGGLLLKALASDSALADDPRGRERLTRALARAASPPSPVAPANGSCSQPGIEAPHAVSDNPMGLKSFQLRTAGAVAQIRIAVGTLDLALPVGLDGVFRRSEQQIDGIAPAARGEWRMCTFVLDLDLVGKIDAYRIELVFGERTRVRVAERTGLTNFEAEAKPLAK